MSNNIKEKRIAVVMSTYNGEKYLREQIDSILNQDRVNITLYVRDDGSTDSSYNILKEYEDNYNNVIVYYSNNIGFAKSFLTGLSKTDDYDYYAFSDQDDYWEPLKLYRAISSMEMFDSNNVLYYSNLNVTDDLLNVFKKTKLEDRKQTLMSVTLRRSIAGCTMVFSNAFREYIKRIEIDKLPTGISHDSILISLAYAIGARVICDSDAYISYRQHGGNVSGSSYGILGRMKKEIKFISALKYNETNLARLLLDVYGEDMIVTQKKTLQLICSTKKNVLARIKILFDPEFSTGVLLLTVHGKIRVILGVL